MKVLSIFLAFISLCAAERYSETLYSAWGQSFEVTQMIHHEKTDFWDVAIFDNPLFGRVLAIDGTIQMTEKDEAIYHEMLVHPALFSHSKPDSVLIIGGGDGATLREVLRHKDVGKVILVEIDRRIMELTKEHMPTLSNGAFDDPRVEVIIADAAQYLKESEVMFDIILSNACDPIGASAALFTQEFYGNCKKRLKEGGILVNQNGVPFLQKEEYELSMKHRKAHFANVTCYLAPIPTYVGGFMAFGWASDAKYTALVEVLKKRLAKVSGKMFYYTPAIHKAAFALPAYLLPAEDKPVKKKGKLSKK